MASAATVKDAVINEARFLPTADPALDGVVMANESALTIEYVFKGDQHELGKREGEFWATATIGMLRQFTRVELVPAAVESTYEGRSDRAEIEAYFNCRVTFEAAANTLMFDASTAELPLEQADAYLNALLVSFHENRLAGTDQYASTLAAKVAVTIAQGLADGTTTAASVARILGMSTRTLTRRLAEEGTSFGSILDQLRADLAVRYIQDLKVPIAEIAWRLGYKEPSAFTVAFKRWTGRPPAAIRREQRDKSPSAKNVAPRHNRVPANTRRSVRSHRG
jgi:AraC-like DNA-binding protein